MAIKNYDDIDTAFKLFNGAEPSDSGNPKPTTTLSDTAPFSIELERDLLYLKSTPQEIISGKKFFGQFIEHLKDKYIQEPITNLGPTAKSIYDLTPVQFQLLLEEDLNLFVSALQASQTVHNALKVGIYRAASYEPKKSDILPPKTGLIPRLERASKIDKIKTQEYWKGIRDGATWKDNKSWLDIAKVTILGKKTTDLVDLWAHTSPTLSKIDNAADFAGEVVFDEAIDRMILGPIAFIGAGLKLGRSKRLLGIYPKRDIADVINNISLIKVENQGWKKYVDDLHARYDISVGGKDINRIDAALFGKKLDELPTGSSVINIGEEKFFVRLGNPSLPTNTPTKIPDYIETVGYQTPGGIISADISRALNPKESKKLAGLDNQRTKLIEQTNKEVESIIEKGKEYGKHIDISNIKSSVSKSNIATRKKIAKSKIPVPKKRTKLNKLVKEEIIKDTEIQMTSIADNILSKVDPEHIAKKVDDLDKKIKIFYNDTHDLIYAKNSKNFIPIDTGTIKNISGDSEAVRKINLFNESQQRKILDMESDILIRQKTISSIYAKEQELTANLYKIQNDILYDKHAISQAIRRDYLSKLMKYNVNDEAFIKRSEIFTDAISLGRTKDIAELTDSEFEGVFDYLDVFSRSANRNFMPFNDVMTPSWYWYYKKGFREIYDAVDIGYTNHLLRGIKALRGWDEHIEKLGGKKALKDEALQRRIFLLANGEEDKYRKLFNEAYDIVDDTVMSYQEEIERNAAQYINDTLHDIGYALQEAGLWPEGLEWKDYYIRNIVKDAAKNRELSDQSLALYLRQNRGKVNAKELINRIEHDDELIENADIAFRTGLFSEIYKLEMEPALRRAEALALLSEDEDVIRYTLGNRVVGEHIPEGTRQGGWLNYAVRGDYTHTEQKFENLSKKLLTAIHYPDKFFGVHYDAPDRAARKLLNTFRSTVYISALGFNTKSMVKQLSQSLMNIPTSGYKSYVWGLRSVWYDSGQDLANTYCRLLIGRKPLEQYDIRSFKGITEKSMSGFQALDEEVNIKAGFNAIMHEMVSSKKEYRDIVSKYTKHGYNSLLVDDVSKGIKEALDNGELRDLAEYANIKIKVNQFSYKSYDMPKLMWDGGAVNKTLFQFSTWPANYYYVYLPELAKEFFTGKGIAGVDLTWSQRMGALKASITGYMILEAGKTIGLNMDYVLLPGAYPDIINGGVDIEPLGGAFPSGYSPMANIIGGLVTSIIGTADANQRIINEGLKMINNGLPYVNATKEGIPYPSTLAIDNLMKTIQTGDVRNLIGTVEKEEEPKKKKKYKIPGGPRKPAGIKTPTPGKL